MCSGQPLTGASLNQAPGMKIYACATVQTLDLRSPFIAPPNPDAPGTVTNPCTRQVFEQKESSSQDLNNFGITEDKELLGENGKGKELLVIVKRGCATNIAEQDT